MNTTSSSNRTHNRLLLGAAMVASSLALGSAASAQADPPEWDECVYRDLPVAASVGGILPVNFVPPPETQAALRGDVAVGTDCSIYDVPV